MKDPSSSKSDCTSTSHSSQSQLPREADEVALATNTASSAPLDQSIKRKSVVRYPILDILLAKNDPKEADRAGMPSDSVRLSQWKELRRKALPGQNPTDLVLVYAPTGLGGIEITARDYNRLEPGEFFNDTLVEFGTMRAFHKMQETNPTLAEQVHLFSSFFYSKLRSPLPSEGYQSVRKWTSKFNLFDKRYIIIPVNEDFHWYLCIIYNPKGALPPQMPPPRPASVITKPVMGQNQTKTIEVVDLDTDGEMDIETATVTNSPNACTLFVLDSFSRVSTNALRKVLVTYLLNEAIDKKLVGSEWDDHELEKWFQDHVVPEVAEVPRQQNFCDCGVYLVHFAEIFLSNPEKAIGYMMERGQSNSADESIWNKSGLKMQRITMKEEIDRLAVEWKAAR
ncbi:uncharacterized protein EI90DRAFT_3105158 [Cantharellus anzutake]|uniref:uncharacterized protein n=1 Tax=Cantharellus anzutake TaxID=1750568 RepID=UPI0019041631|nr:uncharacterized protein EI90DRAFT_3105158 [Cantharellus anzutake]KAF8309452.1 hypothetical protein EI90DRAFT_3105158 [Cantharellus anzutake]